jgi:glycosyltransferase involved in cell wall biosynthesis
LAGTWIVKSLALLVPGRSLSKLCSSEVLPMKIAQVAPLAERVPPKLYGGTERIVFTLTEELVRQGHDVTLFASGDSTTTAKLVPCAEMALRLNPDVRDTIPYQIMLIEKVRQLADEFDVLHFHIDMMHFPLVREMGRPAVTTLHGRLDLPDLQPFYAVFPDMPLVSISDHQRLPMPPVNWVGTVYHGLDRDILPFRPRPEGDYVAFLGRISPEKRPDRAIEITARAGMKLKIAAKVDQVDLQYWNETIWPMIQANPHVEFIGEINEQQKADFLGNAQALLFPIDWPEPFGIVLIEAMACGTPVVACRSGSVPEVIDDRVSGFVVDTIDEAVAALGRIGDLDRARVRRAFDARFTSERMARDYLSIYRRLSMSPEIAAAPLEVAAAAGHA